MLDNSYKELFDSLKKYKDPKEYVNQLTNLISKVLWDRNSFVKNSNNVEQREYFFQVLHKKIEEVYQIYCKNHPNAANINNEVEFIGAGHTHLAFKIGNMVLKVGKSKNQWTSVRIKQYQNIPCLIPVFYDESYKISEQEYYLIQVTPLVDTHQIEEEEIYESYHELRKYGYIWNDPLPENVGRIISDFQFNNHHYKKGDKVIVDLEDIAYVGEDTPEVVLEELSMMSYNRKTYLYEIRYLEEKEKQKIKIKKDNQVPNGG